MYFTVFTVSLCKIAVNRKNDIKICVINFTVSRNKQKDKTKNKQTDKKQNKTNQNKQINKQTNKHTKKNPFFF